MPKTVLLLPVIVAAGWALTLSVGADPHPLSCQPELVTDQPGYPAGATAYLLGSSFLPHENVVLQVQRVGEVTGSAPAHAPWTLEANANGDFLTQWQVCDGDCVGTELEVTAVGEESGRVASARFADQPTPSAEPASPTLVSEPKLIKLGSTTKTGASLQGWLNLLQQWGGTLQGSNSKYGEGDTIPLRFTASLAPGSTHSLLLKYDYSTGGTQRFLDSLGSFNTTVTNVTLPAGISGAGLPSQWPIPTDASLPKGALLPGVLTSYNISQLSFGGYTLSSGVKVLAVTFVVANNSTTNLNIVIGYGGHLASATAWGAGNGSSLFPGASQKAYASLDGASDINESINPGTIIPAADLSLVKSASPQPVISGNNLTYQLVVTNNGPDPAASVAVQDLLPAGATLLSASASQGTWSNANGLVFYLGTLYPSNYATMTVVTKVVSPYAGMITNVATLITNKATVSSSTYDPVPANNTAAAVSTVILDTTPPIITCPATIVQPMDPGQCFATVYYTVTATDDNPGVTLSVTPPSGSRFPQGTNTVVGVATDAFGNTASCSFKVVVVDTQPPALTCPASVTVTNDPSFCSAIVKFNLGVSDNCPGAISGSSPPSGYAFPVGTNIVLCVAQDAAGNTNVCTFTITVLDREPPKLLCPTNLITTTDVGSCFATVSFPLPAATDNCGGPVAVSCNPPSGSVFALGTNPVVCTAIDPAGNSNTCVFSVIVQDAGNQSWPLALPLTLVDNLGVQQATVQECLTALDQSRWFKFKAQPGSRLVVTLTELPENYDLVLFKDIGAAYQSLASLDDLTHVSAEFASDGFSPSAFSSDAFSPSAFSPSAFSPSAFSPSAFSSSAFSPSAFSPSAFSPSAFSPDAFSASALSPSAFSPSAFSPSAFSPNASSPAFSPSAFSAAQIQSVLAVSAFDGTASEGIIADTWDNAGNFYLRVRGRNGVFSTANPFRLTVYQVTGSCGQVSPVALDGSGQPLPPSTTAAPAGPYKTIILTDLNRWLGPLPSADKTSVSSSLAALAARPDVNGVVVDVGADPVVAFFNAQADKYFDCPFAKNLAAGAIKDIVDRSRSGNALQYVVIVGDDSVIPFFRYPDEALLGPERNYVPPVKDLTPSQASLRLDRVLSQDAYGARCNVSVKASQLPLPDLAVGRLVQSASDVVGMVTAYLGTANGVAPSPATSLVSGYDFLADDAEAVANEFALGIGSAPDTLISPNNLAPSQCWTADGLRQALFGKRHDLIFLAGHFSASETLAADYVTHVFASELAGSSNDFRNALIVSPGCHSGYNIVAADGIPFVTIEPDWTEAAARKQATLVAGTGYQYGDTDFIEYSERFYLEFIQALRTGSGPVSVGQALVTAKHAYLEATPQMRGIHTKSYLEATLFGLPMFSVNFPAARLASGVNTPVVMAVQPAASNPGALLGLSSADVTVTSALTPTQVTLNNTADGTQTIATYLAGGSGIVNNPAEPVLPLEARNVSVNGTVLRGVGFRGAIYTDLPGIVPLTGAPTTEIRGVHATFLSEVFYPMRPWNVNYFGSLCGGINGITSLMAIPGQFKSDSPTAATGTLREFSEMDFRLFYNSNITTYVDTDGNSSTPGLAAAPSMSGVLGITSAAGDSVAFSARVVGNPAAGVQEVWVTYTATTAANYGKWQSVELVQNATDSTLWQATLPLNGTPSQAIRYMVQAVNGVGVVALDTKLGAYHIPDEFDSGSTAQLAPTSVILLTPPTTGAFSANATFTAQLTTAGGTPLSGQRMVFGLGDQEIWAMTDSNGVSTASLPLRNPPGSYQVTAAFPGASGLAPSSATSPFTIARQTTALGIVPTLIYVKPNVDSTIVATLTDGAGNRIIERTVLFIVTGPAGSYSVPVITDVNGRAPLGPVPLPAGTYTVTAYFNGTIPLPGQTITVDDGRYFPSTTAGVITVTLVLDDQPPVITCSTNIVQSTTPGRCDAVVNFVTTATDDHPGVTVICTPPSGSVFPKNTNLVTCVATDAAGNTSTCSFTVAVVDREPPVVICPGNIVTNSLLGLCSAPVSFTVFAADNCGPVTVVATPPSGSSFPVGTNIVSVVATDSSGNTSTCWFTVTVLDNQPPQIFCPQNIQVNTDPNLCSAVVKFSVTATDNCSVASVVCTPPSGTAFPKGTTTVNCVATDTSGNTSTCSFTITVVDKQPPQLYCPANLTVPNDPAKASAVVTFTPSASDNCPGVSVVSSPASGSTFPLGTNTVTCVATDAAGNQSICNFTVTVKDVEPPVIQSLGAYPNVLSPPNHTMILVTVTVVATDNSGSVTSKIVSVTSSDPTNTTGDGNTGGDWDILGPLTVYLRAERASDGVGRTYTLTIQATDPSGNAATKTVTVFVPPNSA